jgi:hypothetical protein
MSVGPPILRAYTFPLRGMASASACRYFLIALTAVERKTRSFLIPTVRIVDRSSTSCGGNVGPTGVGVRWNAEG